LITVLLVTVSARSEETLPPLKDGKAPQTFEQVWSGFDPRSEPLDVEVLHEWEQDGTVLKVLRYRVGVFKGEKAMMAAIYGYPKGGSNLPGLVQIHGGGGAGTEEPVLANAKEGYATISIAWDGRIRSATYPIDNEAKQLFWDGKKDDPKYRPTTDWGDMAGFFFPRRYKDFNDPKRRLDPVDSARNDRWFLWAMGARRAITFLEQQPEVDGDRIGVYGHSMGAELTIAVAGSDPRVKVASPSCGGLTRDKPTPPLCNLPAQKQIKCPILFMVPTNDFHGRIHDLPSSVEALQSKHWRIASMPHRNHSSDAAYLASVTLWFNQHLKNEARLPENPDSELTLKTDNGIPVFSITPDRSREVKSVEVYYTQQPATGYKERIPAMTKYWRYAPATNDGGTWTASLPVFTLERQLWVYGDVRYANERAVHCVKGRDIVSSDAFNLSSVLRMVTPEELKAAGVEATEKTSLVIEDFADGWEKEWFAKGQKSLKTFKLKSPQYEAAPASSLGIEVQSDKRARLLLGMEREKHSYHHTIAIDGDSEWQKVVLSPSDFKNREGETLEDWNGLDIAISPLGTLDWRDLKLRNLKWLRDGQRGDNKQ